MLVRVAQSNVAAVREAVPVIIPLLGDEDNQVRIGAIDLLALIAESDSGMVAAAIANAHSSSIASAAPFLVLQFSRRDNTALCCSPSKLLRGSEG